MGKQKYLCDILKKMNLTKDCKEIGMEVKLVVFLSNSRHLFFQCHYAIFFEV
jgi:hypothetical protein